jgi:protein-disulfide isomerase
MVMGDEDAPVTIVEFGDYQCPGCAYFALTVKPQIEAELVETGKAQFVFHDFPLVGSGHPHSFLAARAVRCAMDQDRGWEYHDAIFYNQTRWSPMGDPTNEFVSYATQLGLDTGQFNSCLRSDMHAEVVSANLRLGQELGVNGTPTVLVGGGDGQARRIGMGSDPYLEIAAEVDRLTAGLGEEAEESDEAEAEGSGG